MAHALDDYHESSKKIRFTCFQDIMLLREVLSQDPFSKGKSAWIEITSNISVYVPNITLRTCRDRALRLIKAFKANDTNNLRKCGTEEQYHEKEELLRDVVELEKRINPEIGLNETRKQKLKDKEIESNMKSPSLTVKASAVYSDDDDKYEEDDDEGSERKHKKMKKCEVAEYLKYTNQQNIKLQEKEIALKHEQLEVDRRRLSLEERRLELEYEKWKSEIETRKDENKMLIELVHFVLKGNK
ncbi:hypothetical protein CHUAL_011618 [Chamberlinius hualienensis]